MSAKSSWDFKFTVPPPPAGKLIGLSHAETEEVLLNKLRAAGDNPLDALWQLARFYSHSQLHEKALDYLRQVLTRQPDLEDKAATVLAIQRRLLVSKLLVPRKPFASLLKT